MSNLPMMIKAKVGLLAIHGLKYAFSFCIICIEIWVLLEGVSFTAIYALSQKQTEEPRSLLWAQNYRKLVSNFHPLFKNPSDDVQPIFQRHDPDSHYYVSTRTGYRFRANRIYTGHLVSGNEGFLCNDKCEPLPYQKPPDEFRIFILGGSSVAGHGVEYGNETISGQLEHMIAKSKLFPDQRIRVINAGTGGHFSGQELVTLSYRVMQFHPDMILVYDGYNDFMNMLWAHFDPSAKKYNDLLEVNLS